MAKNKTLKDIIGEASLNFTGNGKDERRFAEKQISNMMFKNMYSTSEYDPMFKGTNVGVIDRSKEHHGYNPGQDDAVYEELDQNELDELIETSVEKRRRYLQRAISSHDMAHTAMKNSYRKGPKEYWTRQVRNRKKGISRAIAQDDRDSGRND